MISSSCCMYVDQVRSAKLMVLLSAGNVTLRRVWMECYKLDEEIRQSSINGIAFYTTSHHR